MRQIALYCQGRCEGSRSDPVGKPVYEQCPHGGVSQHLPAPEPLTFFSTGLTGISLTGLLLVSDCDQSHGNGLWPHGQTCRLLVLQISQWPYSKTQRHGMEQTWMMGLVSVCVCVCACSCVCAHCWIAGLERTECPVRGGVTLCILGWR